MCFGWAVFRVVGNSMQPTLDHGDFAVARRGGWGTPRDLQGKVVVAEHPRLGILVKRVSHVSAEGLVSLSGDSPATTMRADMEPIPCSTVRARVVCRVSPSGLNRVHARFKSDDIDE